MSPSHSYSIIRGRAPFSLALRWTLLLAALILVAALANAQTPAPGETNSDEAPMRAPEQTSHVLTNEVTHPEDRDQNDNPPAPIDAHPGMMTPPPEADTVDPQRAPVDASAKQPAPATTSNAIAPNPPPRAKSEDKSVAPKADDTRPSTPPVADFSAFKIISDRNIFDPNRSPRRTGGPPRRAKTVESVTLVGIMSYGKGDFAFFNGSSSEHKKVLKASDTIAGYKLASIGANSVRLAAGEKEVELKIGSQLRREEEGEWTLSAQSEASPDSAVGSSASTAKPAEAGAASDGADSEVLKRLMQRREQE